jgi:hypothetical protein
MNELANADKAFLLLLVTACLGARLIRAFWELEQSRKRLAQRRGRARNRMEQLSRHKLGEPACEKDLRKTRHREPSYYFREQPLSEAKSEVLR